MKFHIFLIPGPTQSQMAWTLLYKVLFETIKAGILPRSEQNASFRRGFVPIYAV